MFKTCLPKIRKPDKITKNCLNKSYPFKKLNKHGEYCCYKNKTKKSTCPKKRRPNENNECENNLFKRLNKHGDMCCYKYEKKT